MQWAAACSSIGSIRSPGSPTVRRRTVRPRRATTRRPTSFRRSTLLRIRPPKRRWQMRVMPQRATVPRAAEAISRAAVAACASRASCAVAPRVADRGPHSQCPSFVGLVPRRHSMHCPVCGSRNVAPPCWLGHAESTHWPVSSGTLRSSQMHAPRMICPPMHFGGGALGAGGAGASGGADASAGGDGSAEAVASGAEAAGSGSGTGATTGGGRPPPHARRRQAQRQTAPATTRLPSKRITEGPSTSFTQRKASGQFPARTDRGSHPPPAAPRPRSEPVSPTHFRGVSRRHRPCLRTVPPWTRRAAPANRSSGTSRKP